MAESQDGGKIDRDLTEVESDSRTRTKAGPFDRFFGIGSSGRGEALLRVGYSVVLLGDLLGLRRKLDLFFVSGGAHPVTPFEALYSHTVVHAAYWTWLGVAALLLLGLFTRAASVANLCLLIFFFGLRGYVAPHASDWVLHAMGFCLVLMTSDRHLTLRHLARGRLWGAEDVLPGWPLRVAQLTYAGVFFTAGLSKVGDPGWRNGSAFPAALFNPLVTRPDLTWLEPYAGALALVGIAVVVWELAYPFLLWSRRTLPWTLASGVVFLVGVDLTLRVGWFTWDAIVFGAVFFDDLRSRGLGVPSTSLGLRPSVRAFLIVHTFALGLTMASYAALSLGGRLSTGPLLGGYARYIAGIHYYNVWPTVYVPNPIRMITYDATTPSGARRPIPPFDADGRLKLGYFSREVREGLLGLRVERAGMGLGGWEKYAEYIADRYADSYGGECPSEIRFYGIRAPLSEFAGRPKDLRIPRTLLATATFDCSNGRVRPRVVGLVHS